MPTSVLLAVLAAAGLLALAPALVRRYDATERLVAERALSTARAHCGSGFQPIAMVSARAAGGAFADGISTGRPLSSKTASSNGKRLSSTCWLRSPLSSESRRVPRSIPAFWKRFRQGMSADLALPFPGTYYTRPRRSLYKHGVAFYWAGYPDQAVPYIEETIRRSPDNTITKLRSRRLMSRCDNQWARCRRLDCRRRSLPAARPLKREATPHD